MALLLSCQKQEPRKTAPDLPVTEHAGPPVTHQPPDYHGLIREYRTLLAEDPGNLAALIGLGNTYYDIGQWQSAATIYQHALARDPRNADVHTDRGTALRNLGMPDQAIAEYQRALTLDSSHLDARYNLGIVYAYDKKDANAAIRTWEELLRLSPNYRNAEYVRRKITALHQKLHTGAR